MYANKYTRERAEQLVPILRSIASEIDERTRTIERLEGIFEAPSSASRPGKSSGDLRGLGARLANQKRELRLARQELGRFGCALDEDHPLRVLIPGEDGTLENGYAWDPAGDILGRRAAQMAS